MEKHKIRIRTTEYVSMFCQEELPWRKRQILCGKWEYVSLFSPAPDGASQSLVPSSSPCRPIAPVVHTACRHGNGGARSPHVIHYTEKRTQDKHKSVNVAFLPREKLFLHCRIPLGTDLLHGRDARVHGKNRLPKEPERCSRLMTGAASPRRGYRAHHPRAC